MKKISKLFMFLGLTLLVVSSCLEEGIVREPSPEEIAQGVYFLPSNNTDITVQSTATSVTYKLGRVNTAGSVTVPLTSQSAAPFTVPTSVTFAAGAATADVVVTFGTLTPVPQSVIINIDPAYAALYGAGHNQFKGTVKAINWQLLGTGKFSDFWNFANNPYNVQIYKAEGMNRWRVMAPYTEGVVAEGFGAYTGPLPEFIEFYLDGTIVYWDEPFDVGYLYQANPATPVKAYHPRTMAQNAGKPGFPATYAFSTPESWAFNKRVNTKKFQLAPHYYIVGLGGWNWTQRDNAIIIDLP